MIDISKFEKSLIKEAMSAFDLSDTSFNKNQIINPVSKCFKRDKNKTLQSSRQKVYR